MPGARLAGICASAFSVGLIAFSTLCMAEEVQLRKAATRSAPANVPEYRQDSQAASKGPIGFQPVPYQPTTPADRQEKKPVQYMTYPDIRELAKRVNKSVVAIRLVDGGLSWSLGEYGGSKGDNGGKATGYGSGFIVSASGHIVTNEHVLRNGSKIEVELLDGSKYMARLVHKDAKNDLALLKIDAHTGLQPVHMGNSENVELGEWVVGIGNPYGIGQSLMIGIVSAKDRRIPGSGYPPLIQIDAAMNLGNSGGPLFNMDGEVVGINTILLWKSQGIGFATPVNIVKRFLAESKRSMGRSASASAAGPLGPAGDAPRAIGQTFNPLDPPWKSGR
ncbi:MAG: trypsin-like peptidase domain-containing protein [Desulfomonile sp.]|nr:trypsin-like peptidase domain-containing protein [Desulfomonile sp.]